MNKEGAPRIDGWFTTNAGRAPELGIRIGGFLGREPILTSYVRHVDGKFVQTETGSVYELGTIDPGFMEELIASNYPFDPENPIRLLDSDGDRRPLKKDTN